MLFDTGRQIWRLAEYLDYRRWWSGTSTCAPKQFEPLARAYLAQQGVPCADTLPFFTNDSHARVLH